MIKMLCSGNPVKFVCFALAAVAFAGGKAVGDMPSGHDYTNAFGMKFVRVEPGTFQMGETAAPLSDELIKPGGTNVDGDYDEHPVHNVTMSKALYMGVYDVTNFQYELFDPGHKKLRERSGRCRDDDSPVVQVTWYDAQEFCRWLSDKDGLAYRLPTEAEWEYACRAGTTSPFSTGLTLPSEFTEHLAGSVKVGQAPANPWGLYDMHGSVEQWCSDWYGPYEAADQKDPVGRATGDIKVTRGGHRFTDAYYKRSANRLGTIAEDKNSIIGFRVVIGDMPQTKALAKPPLQPYQRDVRQEVPVDVTQGTDPDKPYFEGPRLFMKLPSGDRGPLYRRHNHFVSVTDCPNGDLLAIWHTCIGESGRELSVAASRLRYGKKEWEPASLFWDTPDRNDHGHALWFDGDRTIFHFNGIADVSRNVALMLRTSTDNGVTWSQPRIIAGHGPSRMPIESVFRTREGFYCISCDKGPNVLWVSRDKGLAWAMTEGEIRGKHAAAMQLNDGRLFALGRERNIDGKMPISISGDMGRTWQYSASEFQPVSWGQRPVLLRLKEGPILFASFCKRMMIKNDAARQHPISGLFAAVSFDEGETWPDRRLVSDDGPGRDIETMNGHLITLDQYNSEVAGYLAVCQSADNVIHLLSSREHYAFNYKWLTTLPPPAPEIPPLPQAKELPEKVQLAKKFKPVDSRGRVTEVPSPDGGASKAVKISTIDGGGFYLRSTDTEDFINVDHTKGFTAEIKTRILKRKDGERGLDIELYDGAAARYAVSFTDTGIYWYEGFVVGSALLSFDQFMPVVEGLDNTDRMHTFRIAVRRDRVTQIYRDGKLIGTRRYEYRTPREAYIQVGAGTGLEALVEYVAYDITGAYQP